MNSGDVIVLPFFGHQEDKTQGEARWAIILEDLGDSYSVIPMTCQTNQVSKYSKTIIVKLKSKDAIQMKINCDSLIIVDREAQLSKVHMKAIHPVGKCSESLIDKIFELYNS